jgi:DNA-nicking Smr family endonuclease
MPKPLSPEESALWARVIATVAPLRDRAPPPAAGASAPARAEPPPAQRPAIAAAPAPPRRLGGAAPPVAPARSGGLDGAWDRRLVRGDVAPDLVVDLHGHSLDSAYRTLDQALAEAVAGGARLLLLVTGKPRAPGTGRGAIRAAVADWLAASRHADRIAAVRGAHLRHGGSGALYVVLRRRRTAPGR